MQNITTQATTRYDDRAIFPLILHAMLEDAAKKNFESIVSWLPNSNLFKVHDAEKFVQYVMKHYFARQSQYKSFSRQLNLYGFERVKEGPRVLRGAYFHPLFVRGCAHLCSKMQRPKAQSAMTGCGPLQYTGTREATDTSPPASAFSPNLNRNDAGRVNVRYPTSWCLDDRWSIPEDLVDDIIDVFGRNRSEAVSNSRSREDADRKPERVALHQHFDHCSHYIVHNSNLQF